MKIIDPNTQAMTPRAQMWIGVIVSVVLLFEGIRTVTRPMTTSDQMAAYSAFTGVVCMAWLAWCGYRRQSKTESSK
jgi:hypothetical protein